MKNCPAICACIYLQLAPEKTGLFRFLMEAYDNLALFTVLNKKTALIKVSFAEASRDDVLTMLADIGQTIALQTVFAPDPAGQFFSV